MSAKSYWYAFGIGLTAGAAIALLYAPQSGVRTRKRLRKNIEDAGDYLEDAGDYLKAQAERFSGEAQTAIERARKEVASAVDTATAAAQNVAKSARSLV